MIDLGQMGNLEQAATAGPWAIYDEGFWPGVKTLNYNHKGKGKSKGKICNCEASLIIGGTEGAHNNAAFIAAARSFVPEAIKLIRQQQKALELALEIISESGIMEYHRHPSGYYHKCMDCGESWHENHPKNHAPDCKYAEFESLCKQIKERENNV